MAKTDRASRIRSATTLHEKSRAANASAHAAVAAAQEAVARARQRMIDLREEVGKIRRQSERAVMATKELLGPAREPRE